MTKLNMFSEFDVKDKPKTSLAKHSVKLNLNNNVGMEDLFFRLLDKAFT